MDTSKHYEIVGKTRVYNTDGTGRDTYIGFDNGGNTFKYEPAKAHRQGAFNQTSPGGWMKFPKQKSAAIKNVHYHSDGTGRDSYIHVDQGGYMSNYHKKNVNDRHVAGLRVYGTSVKEQQIQVAALSSKRTSLSPQKDFFVEGQVSIRSPIMRQKIGQASVKQRNSIERLSSPKYQREHFANTIHAASGSPHKNEYLRSSREMNFTPIEKHAPAILQASNGFQMSRNARQVKAKTVLGTIENPKMD